MKPTPRPKELDALLDSIAQNFGHGGRKENIEIDMCVICGGAADKFKDALSIKEYTISGLCQACQDDTFGGDEDDYNEDYENGKDY